MSDSRTSPRGLRRRIIPIVAVTAAVTLGAAVFGVAHLVRQDDDNRTTAPQTPPIMAAEPGASISASPVPAAPPISADPPQGDDTQPAGAGAGGAIGLAMAPISLRYTFDGGPSSPVTDSDGRYPLRIVTQADGALNFASVPASAPEASGAVPMASRAAGLSMQFPPRCELSPKTCPRAILEGVRDDALNPGTRPLQYGASILMSPADTGDGANVLQKGYSVGGGNQFKLQVDHDAARPSCVIADRSKIYRVEPRVSLADSVWHTVVCTRSGSRLGITVDGVARGSVFVPPALSIANAEPLRIGGKGANAGNDQFAGQIDNVFLNIS